MRKVLHGVAVTGAVLSAALVVYMGVATVTGVVLRYVFLKPNRFLFESTELALALAVFLVLGYVATRDGHVRVDLIPARFARTNSTLLGVGKIATGVLLTPFAYVAARMSIEDFERGMRLGTAHGLPRWIPMAALTVALLLVALSELRSSWLIFRKPETYREELDRIKGGVGV